MPAFLFSPFPSEVLVLIRWLEEFELPADTATRLLLTYPRLRCVRPPVEKISELKTSTPGNRIFRESGATWWVLKYFLKFEVWGALYLI